MIGIVGITDTAPFDFWGPGVVTLTAEDWGDASAVFERLMPETSSSPVWSDLTRPGKLLPPAYASYKGTVDYVDEFRQPFTKNEERVCYFFGGDGSLGTR